MSPFLVGRLWRKPVPMRHVFVASDKPFPSCVVTGDARTNSALSRLPPPSQELTFRRLLTCQRRLSKGPTNVHDCVIGSKWEPRLFIFPTSNSLPSERMIHYPRGDINSSSQPPLEQLLLARTYALLGCNMGTVTLEI